MTSDPIKNTVICTGILAFIVSMAALGVVNLCWDFFEVYLSIPPVCGRQPCGHGCGGLYCPAVAAGASTGGAGGLSAQSAVRSGKEAQHGVTAESGHIPRFSAEL